MIGLIATTLFAPLLTPQNPIEVPGPVGRFDGMLYDPIKGRVLAAHSAVGGLAVLDTKTRKVVSLPGAKCNGIAVDPKCGRILAAGGDKKLVAWDWNTLEKVGEVDLDGPGDILAYEPDSGLVYVDEDDGTHSWVFDAATLMPAGNAVAIAGAPEWIEYDPATKTMFQNIKEPGVLQFIDPASRMVTKTVELKDLKGPHGMVVDSKDGVVFSAGKNNTLVAVDAKTGDVLGKCAIAAGVDQIDFDPASKRIYCACSKKISVAAFADGKLTALGDVDVPAGGHTLVVDRKTHIVWLSYADATHSYLRGYRPS